MKVASLVLILVLSLATFCFAQDKSLLIDDFENPISGGPEGTVDFGAGNGSSVDVKADAEIKNSGKQSLKISYAATPGGYMWVARGFGLDAQNADWLVKSEAIDWPKYKAISFYMYGSNSRAQIAFDIKDAGGEMWRFMLEDNCKGWKKIACPFNAFFARSDWQPDNADKNSVLDFPIRNFQFELLPEAKGTLYFDTAELVSNIDK